MQAKGKGWGEGETFAPEGFGCPSLAWSRGTGMSTGLAPRRHVHVSSCLALDLLLVSVEAGRVPVTVDLCTSPSQIRGQDSRKLP